LNLIEDFKEMPKIADIQETPNPNAVKFILKEPVSHGTSHSFDSADKAKDDQLAQSLFDVGDVVSVFYMDKMITVEKTDEADWDEILPILAVPIRAAESVAASNGNGNGNAASAVGGAIAAAVSDNPVIAQINELLDEKIRPYLASDGGWLEVLDLEDKTLKIRYQGACGSCPSSLSGTLMAIENMIRDEIDEEIEVVAV
jgi:Fe-S cluster biogenesis protein NfuA